jgi:hypothetical protein
MANTKNYFIKQTWEISPAVIPLAFILPPMRWPFGSLSYTKPDAAISHAEFRSTTATSKTCKWPC